MLTTLSCHRSTPEGLSNFKSWGLWSGVSALLFLLSFIHDLPIDQLYLYHVRDRNLLSEQKLWIILSPFPHSGSLLPIYPVSGLDHQNSLQPR